MNMQQLSAIVLCGVWATQASDTFTKDLSPQGNTPQVNITQNDTNGITPEILFADTHQVDVWFGVQDTSQLGWIDFNTSGQVKLSIGKASPQNGQGTVVGLPFTLQANQIPQTLTFNITESGSWNQTNFNQFDCTVSVKVYGHTESGTNTLLGSWEQQNAENAITQQGIVGNDNTHNPAVTIQLTGESQNEPFQLYGLII